MLRPRVQQLSPRPNSARTKVRADRDGTAETQEAEPADEQIRNSTQERLAISSHNYRRVLCAGLFGVTRTAAAPAEVGGGLAVPAEQREA